MKSLRYILCICVVLSAAGCTRDLDLAPLSNANVAGFYRNAQDINNAVIAAYKFHKQIYTANFCVQSVLDEIRSDNTTMVQIDVVDRFIRDTGKEWFGWSWDHCYRAIYMANLAMEKAVGVEMDESQRNQYIAEARFLRALVYFELVRNFGDVPLILSTPVSFAPEDVQVTRTPAAQVYDQIIGDLQFAASQLPATRTGSEVGRATSWAARGILGKVHLTVGDKPAAVTVLREVVNSNQYRLLDTYEEVFHIDSRNSAESLFELQYRAVTDASPMMNAWSSIGAAGIPGGGLGYNLATQDLVDAYEPGDLRKDLSITPDPNGVYYTIKFHDPNMTTGSNSSHNYPILRYAEVLLLLAEAIGESPESYGYINQIRNRAGLSDIDENSPGTFEEKLLQERRVELAFENHRWHDLLRFGVAIPVMNAHFAYIGLAITIGQDDLLMPIPQTAISSNPKLVQNPGY